MTERQKIQHVVRRIGFGATADEIDRFEKAGSEATIAELTDYSPEEK